MFLKHPTNIHGLLDQKPFLDQFSKYTPLYCPSQLGREAMLHPVIPAVHEGISIFPNSSVLSSFLGFTQVYTHCQDNSSTTIHTASCQNDIEN